MNESLKNSSCVGGSIFRETRIDGPLVLPGDEGRSNMEMLENADDRNYCDSNDSKIRGEVGACRAGTLYEKFGWSDGAGKAGIFQWSAIVDRAGSGLVTFKPFSCE